MTGGGWTRHRAAVWRAAEPPVFEPAIWSWAGAGVLVLTFVFWPGFWTDPPCGEPGSWCGPSTTLALVVPLIMATLAALWSVPSIAGVLSAALAFVGVSQWSTVAPLVLLWPGYSLALALWLWHARARRRRQSRIVAGALEPLPPAARAALRQARPPGEWTMSDVAAVAVAAAGLVLGPLGYALYAQQADADRESVSRSSVLEGTVVAVRPLEEGSEDVDYGVLEVSLNEAPGGMADTVELEPLGDYVVGDVVVVRIDPSRSDWAHLADEPPDRTLALGAGHTGVLLGLVATVYLGISRTRARTPRSPEHGIRVLADRRMRSVYLRPMAPGGSWFATLRHNPKDRTLNALGPRPSAEEVFIVGLDRRGLVRLVTPSGSAVSDAYVLEPAAQGWQGAARSVVTSGGGALPEAVASASPSPVECRVPTGQLSGAWALGIASLVLPAALVPLGVPTWLVGIGILLCTATMAVAVHLAAPRVQVDERRITIRRAFRQQRLPMWAVAQVRLHYDQRIVLLDNRGERVDLDLGGAGAAVAGTMAAYAAAHPVPRRDEPGTGFAETTTSWWRETPLYVLAPAAFAGVAWLVGS